MSVSVKNEGIINPIEIDPTFTIITGEMRWRAATEAGLKTVPCKVIDIEPGDRFLRQMHENVHELTMNDWDTAEGLKRSSEILQPGCKINQEAIANEYGKTQQWVSEHLALLEQRGEVRKALKKGKLDYTRLRVLNTAPEEHKEFVQKIVLDKTISREAARNIAKVLKTSHEAGQEDVVEDIKKTDWSGKLGFEIAGVLHKIAPSRIETVEEASKLVQKDIIDLIELLEKYPMVFFGGLGTVAIMPYVIRLGNFLNEYLTGNKKLK